jgi:uncharacterized damage-inducible protein DinB
MADPLLETWQIHQRINLYLLDGIADTDLASTSASKGRTVAAQFSHIHNVRLMWLKVAAPDLHDKLQKIEDPDILMKSDLATALTASAQAIGELLGRGKIKGFKPHATAFIGYLISHESHHRGQIMLSLKQSGHPIDKKIAYGLWEWGSR